MVVPRRSHVTFDDMMKNNIQIPLYVALTLFLAGCAHFHLFKGREPTLSPDVAKALAIFQDPTADFKTSRKAWDYLEEHPNESTSPLLAVVKTKGNSWQSAGHILAKTKNDDVLYTFIELLADNLFETEADGSRRLSPKGVSYGGNIAEFLGEMGDKRAIPVLRNAVDKGDHQVRWAAIEALYYLGDISMDQLFKMGVNEGYSSTGHVILSIAWNDAYSDPAFILTVLDRFLETFPEEEFEVSLAHRYKMNCYDYLGKYDEALREADIIFEMLGYLPSPTESLKERIWNKMIQPPTDTWTYIDAPEEDAECSLNLNILFKTNEVKVSTAYTSSFKAYNYPVSDTNSVHSICNFPIETSVPRLDGDNGSLATPHSSYGVTSITKTGVVVRVEFECSYLPQDEYNCDVNHSILIPFGGTGRCKKDALLYRWKWKNLKSNQGMDPTR